MNWCNPPILRGSSIELIPLNETHRAGLLEAASNGKLWELWYTSVPSATNIDAYMQTALKAKENHNAFPFTIIDTTSGLIIGSTRFCNIAAEHKRLEIGYTWYSKSFQRTGANTQCKYLLLQYAFEELQCICVQFKTHWHNRASRVAIERLGARLDGVLRNDRLGVDGSRRDTVVYSILDSEWDQVKKGLEFAMHRP